MRSIVRRATEARRKYPGIARLPALNEAVAGQGFSRRAIREAINEYVPKSDYSEEDKKEIVDYAVELTNQKEEKIPRKFSRGVYHAEDYRFRGVNRPVSEKST